MNTCPLCHNSDSESLHQTVFKDKGVELHREYLHCPVCHLVYLRPNLRLPAESEKSRYLEHNNDLSNPGYREFLEKLWEPTKLKISKTDRGLDYGCGPTKALCQMAGEEGYELLGYDPFFSPEVPLISENFNYITSTEVVEHFYNPNAEFNKLWSLLKPGGVLAVMTDLLEGPESFSDWYYYRDPTHVSFYQKESFQWLQKNMGWEIKFHSRRVVFLSKPTI